MEVLAVISAIALAGIAGIAVYHWKFKTLTDDEIERRNKAEYHFNKTEYGQ